ncbi:MAG TPA: hypothetical protein VF043_02205 [Ktedonobacteraceae bacterium]
MLRNVLMGTIAGAAGTVALDIASYADMAIRGRPSSNAPAKLVENLAKIVHLPLSSQGTGSNDQTVQNRESGLGALLGYVNGLGTGALYGLVRSQLDNVPIPLAGILVGLAAMAESDVPLITLGKSDPKSWGFSGWTADIIPHLIYGLVTVLTYEALTGTE